MNICYNNSVNQIKYIPSSRTIKLGLPACFFKRRLVSLLLVGRSRRRMFQTSVMRRVYSPGGASCSSRLRACSILTRIGHSSASSLGVAPSLEGRPRLKWSKSPPEFIILYVTKFLTAVAVSVGRIFFFFQTPLLCVKSSRFFFFRLEKEKKKKKKKPVTRVMAYREGLCLLYPLDICFCQIPSSWFSYFTSSSFFPCGISIEFHRPYTSF